MEIKEIASGLKFPEGPVAMDDGSVIVVEIAAGRVTRVRPDGSTQTIATPGGGPNGLAIGPDFRLYCCNNGGNFEYSEVNGLSIPGHTPANHQGGRIERIDIATGKVEVLYDSCDGARLQAPNDIVFDSAGGFWFTDYAKNDAVKVEVTGLQFAWYFRYPGPDGNYGRTKPELIDASAGGEAAVGMDSTDPASKDDFVTGTMYLPVNREADLTLRAQDVIHSFFVPSMRFKQDAVPGLMIHMHFTPDKVGDYEIACAELCGLGHYKMHGILKVVSQKEFDAWTAQHVAEKQ